MAVIESARALLIDPDDRVLLIKLDIGRAFGENRAIWLTPGGSLHPGESHEDALLREIREETGLTLAHPGHWVWTSPKRVMRDGEQYRLRIEAHNGLAGESVREIPFHVRNGVAITVSGLEPHQEIAGQAGVIINAYAGNIAASFALYFAALTSTARYRHPRLLAAQFEHVEEEDGDREACEREPEGSEKLHLMYAQWLSSPACSLRDVSKPPAGGKILMTLFLCLPVGFDTCTCV